MAVDRLAVAVQHLDLVAAAQVDAGVRPGGHAHVVLEVEVVEVGALGHEVRAAASPGAVGLETEFVGKDAVLKLPAVLGLLIHICRKVEKK